MVNTTLKDTAPVTMSGNLDAVSSDSIIYELIVFRDKPVQALLNNVIAIEILDQRNNVKREGSDDSDNLVVVPRISLRVNGDRFSEGKG
jgi:hypothetical protein